MWATRRVHQGSAGSARTAPCSDGAKVPWKGGGVYCCTWQHCTAPGTQYPPLLFTKSTIFDLMPVSAVLSVMLMPPTQLVESLGEGDEGGPDQRIACMETEGSAETRKELKACAPMLKPLEPSNRHSGRAVCAPPRHTRPAHLARQPRPCGRLIEPLRHETTATSVQQCDSHGMVDVPIPGRRTWGRTPSCTV